MFLPDPDLDLDLDFLPIPDPGSRGQKGIGSRIRNTGCDFGIAVSDALTIRLYASMHERGMGGGAIGGPHDIRRQLKRTV
jgi:hypothetical protein